MLKTGMLKVGKFGKKMLSYLCYHRESRPEIDMVVFSFAGVGVIEKIPGDRHTANHYRILPKCTTKCTTKLFELQQLPEKSVPLSVLPIKERSEIDDTKCTTETLVNEDETEISGTEKCTVEKEIEKEISLLATGRSSTPGKMTHDEILLWMEARLDEMCTPATYKKAEDKVRRALQRTDAFTEEEQGYFVREYRDINAGTMWGMEEYKREKAGPTRDPAGIEKNNLSQ